MSEKPPLAKVVTPDVGKQGGPKILPPPPVPSSAPTTTPQQNPPKAPTNRPD